jgi:pyruvate formate lyase activating enzyme
MTLFRNRVGLLDGIVFSGGEPTLQSALPEAMREARDLGLAIGLHTAGAHPERLVAILDLVDWIGFDIKAPFRRYAEVTGVPGSGTRARDSLRSVLASGVPVEVRTTVHPGLLDASAMSELADDLASAGVRDFVVQRFRPDGCREEFVAAMGSAAPELPEGFGDHFSSMTVR